MFSPDLLDEARDLLAAARTQGVMIATAESCTGGLIAACLTEIAGSSDVVDCGFVTYSNTAKRTMLGVPAELLESHGAVSAPVARAMAEGALVHSAASLAIAVTGIAGPGGGTADKPVGLVYMAGVRQDGEMIAEKHLFGDPGRETVRLETVRAAFRILRALLVP